MSDYLRRKFAEIMDEEQPTFWDVADVTATMMIGLFLKSTDFGEGRDRLSTFDQFAQAIRLDLIDEIAAGKAED